MHVSLRQAAGLFILIRDMYIPNLYNEISKGSDLDKTIIEAYIQQCLAEAQESMIFKNTF